MKKSLFEITTDYENLFSRLEIMEDLTEEETWQLLKDLEINENELAEKASNYIKRITTLEGEIDVIKQEKDRLTTLASSKQKEVQKLKLALLLGLKNTGKDKLDLVTNKISIRKSNQTNVEELERKLNEGLRVKPEIVYLQNEAKDLSEILSKAGGLKITLDGVEVNKNVAKKLLDAGDITEGVVIIQNESLVIK